MTKKILTKLTGEQEAQMRPWADQWIARGLRTAPLTVEEKRAIEAAVVDAHDLIGKAPPRVVWAPSPMVGMVSAGVAAGVWWLRENRVRAQTLFGADVSDAQAVAAAINVARWVVSGRPLRRIAADDAVDYAVRDAVSDAVDDAVSDAVDGAVRGAVRGAVSGAVDDAVSDAVDGAVRGAVRGAVSDAVSGAVSDAVSNAVGNAVDGAVRGAVDDAVSDAVDGAVRGAVRGAVDGAVTSLHALDMFFARCVDRAWYMRDGGNMWAGWAAWHLFFTDVCGVKVPERELGVWRRLVTAGWRFSHERFVVACELPTTLKCDERGRLHSESGPAIEWADGYAIHAWRGTRVPREWIEQRDRVDPSLALTHENIEQRRALCEILGWAKVIAQLNPRTIDKDPDPQVGELLEVDLPDAPGTRFLRVRCGTSREFVLGVPREMKTALEANAWGYDVKPIDIRNLEVRT